MPAITRTSQVKQHVLELIRSESFDPEHTALSERKLSEATGASRTTIRRALKELIEAGILLPKRGSGTFVNLSALKTNDQQFGQHGTIGILFYGQYINSPGSGYGWEVLQSISKGLNEAGWGLTHLIADAPGTLAAEKLAAKDVAGLIWVSPSPQERPTIEALHERGVPLLLVNRRFEPLSIPSVMINEKQEGELAAKHLLDLGHRDILFIGVDSERPHLQERYAGFSDAFLRYRTTHNRDLLLNCFPAESVYKSLRTFIRSKRFFSAVFIADSLYLPAVMSAFRDDDLRCPDDFSLVAHSVLDRAMQQFFQPDQVCQPLEELGLRSAKRIIEIVKDNSCSLVHETLSPAFLMGKTCAKSSLSA